MYPFLENFDKRMEQVAIHRFLNEKAALRDDIKQGLLDNGQALNVYMEILCFVMEKSLLETSCTLEDIEAFLVYVLARMIDQGLMGEVNTGELTRYLVRDALQNKGKPYYFETYDFKEQRPKLIHVQLLKEEILTKDGQELFSYHLTTQGYAFLFGTLEVEESLQVSFEQLKLEYAIKKRNFGSARDSVDNLFTLNRKQIQKIREYIIMIKEDIGMFSTNDYETTYASTFETLKEQKDKHMELHDLIERTKSQYMELDHDGGKSHKIKEDLTNIDYIKSRLQHLLNEQMKMFSEQQTLADVYDEAISNVLYIGFENRLNIEKDLVERLEENPWSLDGMAKILRPLMKPQVARRFNVAKAYGPQKIESDEENPEEVSYFLDKGEEAMSELIKERIAYVQGHYSEIVRRIFAKAMEKGKAGVYLSEIYEVSSDIELLRNVLIQLHSDKIMDMKEVVKNNREHMYEPEEDFDLGYAYGLAMEKEPKLSDIRTFTCDTGTGQMVVIQNKVDKKVMKCHDLWFRCQMAEEGVE